MATHAPGYITSSTVSRLLTGKGDKLLKGGRTFAKQIAMERFGVIDEESNYDGGWATEWGEMYEDQAIERYEQETFQVVHSMQKGITAEYKDEGILESIEGEGWLSCTPDGYIDEDGLTEIKCPYKSQNHMDNLLDSKWIDEYEEQCRFQMMIGDRDWVDLISYDPRWPKPMDIHWVRLVRDPEWEDFCKDRIRQAEEIIAKTLKKLNNISKTNTHNYVTD